ncbi:MAG: hypothetical protein JW932_05860 [Deltaproteobacteria bacterium]|nr:hypothetical protein [Deltaproteobacteria bacterium]
MKKPGVVLLVMAVLLMVPLTIQARVTEMVITNTVSPTFGGMEFGKVGQYERLEGIMYCEVDPGDPLNAVIVNIDKAPLNENGKVEFDVDFVIIKPVNLKKGNRHILYDTVNRGGMITLGTYNNAPRVNDPNSAEAAGNGFLMEKGYTIVASGWQAPYPIAGIPSFFVGLGSRIPPAPGALTARLPIALNEDGSSIVAMSREEYFDPPFNMPGPGGVYTKYLTYPAAVLDESQATLTVRYHENDPNKVPVTGWSYLDEYRITFPMPAGYDAGSLYEFIFPAKDPIVYGLGYAGIRDVVSFLRYREKDDMGNRNPLRPERGAPIKKALAYGASQTGRIIKTFVYEGFNEDEKGKIVFDGINSHIGASRKNWLNGEFSHPGDIFGADQFPFTYTELTDHFTGISGSMLERCEASHTCPKIMHTDTESEIWSSAANLVIGDTEALSDIQLPANVRAYMFTGAKHGSGGVIGPPSAMCQQITNPLDYSPLSRAVLVALDKWVTCNIKPPASQYPSISEGTFVFPEELDFPDIPALTYYGYNLPAVNYNALYLRGYWLDYSVQPPEILGEYPVLAMDVDEDGNGVAGVRLPDIQVPVGTYTGWNRTNPGFGGDYRLCTASGSFIPFAPTEAERLANGDPRLSLEERYPSHKAYVKEVARAALKLVHQRLLLWDDAVEIVKKAYESDIGN